MRAIRLQGIQPMTTILIPMTLQKPASQCKH